MIDTFVDDENDWCKFLKFLLSATMYKLYHFGNTSLSFWLYVNKGLFLLKRLQLRQVHIFIDSGCIFGMTFFNCSWYSKNLTIHKTFLNWYFKITKVEFLKFCFESYLIKSFYFFLFISFIRFFKKIFNLLISQQRNKVS